MYLYMKRLAFETDCHFYDCQCKEVRLGNIIPFSNIELMQMVLYPFDISSARWIKLWNGFT